MSNISSCIVSKTCDVNSFQLLLLPIKLGVMSRIIQALSICGNSLTLLCQKVSALTGATLKRPYLLHLLLKRYLIIAMEFEQKILQMITYKTFEGKS